VDYGEELIHSVAIAGTIGSPSSLDCNKSLHKRSIEETTAVTTQKEPISPEESQGSGYQIIQGIE
jgi:hypothetical protein